MPKNDSSIEVSPTLVVTVLSPNGTTKVHLNRVHAQHLCATLGAFAGVPAKGILANAGTFRMVPATSVQSVDGPPKRVHLTPRDRAAAKR